MNQALGLKLSSFKIMVIAKIIIRVLYSVLYMHYLILALWKAYEQ